MKEEDYTERVEISEADMTEAQRLIIYGLMREGEIVYKQKLSKILETEISTYLDEVDGDPNIEWVDGVRYVLHLIKEMDIVNE